MGLFDQAQADIEQITSNDGEWAKEITFKAPTNETCTFNGIHVKHHLGVTSEGDVVNAKTAHVAVSEKFFIDNNYPVRDSTGEVNLVLHQISVKDSTGLVKKYVAQSVHPDESLGFIVIILGDFAED